MIHDGDPTRGIPAVVWTTTADAAWPFTLHDLSDRLRMRGWQVPTYPFTGDLATTDFQRILVKRGFTRELAELLLTDIDQAIAFLTAHPPAVGPAAGRGGYSHT
jgi:glutamate decarboxylase